MVFKMCGIYGRNFNLAIRSPKDGVFRDIGNIIVIEDADTKYGVEAAFGESNTISKINGLDNSIQADYISYFIDTTDKRNIKLADSVSVTTHLIHEGVKPGGSNTQRKVLREYIKAMLYWSEKNGVSLEDIAEIMKRYELFEYGFNTKELLDFNKKLCREESERDVL